LVDTVISNPETVEEKITPGFCGKVIAVLTRALQDGDVDVVSQTVGFVGLLLRLDWLLKERVLSTTFPIRVRVLYLGSPAVHPNSLDVIGHITVERLGLAQRWILELVSTCILPHSRLTVGSNPASNFEDKDRAIRFVHNLAIIVCPAGLEWVFTPERLDMVLGLFF
jgi:hypothetical protein